MAIGPMANPDDYGTMLDEEQKKQQALAAPATPAQPVKPPVPSLEAAQTAVTSPTQTTQTTQTTRITEPGFKPSAAATKEQESALQAQEKAARSVASAQEQAIKAESYFLKEKEAQQTLEAERVQKQREDYKKNLASEMGRYENAYNELADAQKIEVNPRRYIDNMSTGSKVMVGIGLLLSAFGGADNVTKSMNIINKAVDDDISQQKLAREGKIEAAKGRISSIDKKVQQVRDNLQDDRAFDALERDLRFGAIETQIQTAISNAKAPEVQAKLEQGLAAIQQQRADNKMKLEELARDKSKTQTSVETKVEPTKPVEKGKAMEAALTPAEKKTDETYGKEYADYAAAGGRVGLEKKIAKLDKARERLSATDMPSRLIGALPETAQKVLAPKFAEIGDDIKGAVQDTLRQVLGSQFTEKEGAAIMNRAFDPALSKEENLRRLDNVIGELKAQARAKQQAADYYEQMGTLKGFKSKPIEAPAQAEKPQATGPYGSRVKQGGKTYVWNGSTYVEE